METLFLAKNTRNECLNDLRQEKEQLNNVRHKDGQDFIIDRHYPESKFCLCKLQYTRGVKYWLGLVYSALERHDWRKLCSDYFIKNMKTII